MIKFIAMIFASACALAAGADTARVSLKLRGRGEEGGEGEGGVNVQVSVGKVNEDYDELLSGGWCSGHIDQNDQHELTLPFNEDHDLPYPGNYYRVIRAGALCDPSDSPSGPITNDQCQSGTGTQCLPIGNELKCCVIPQDGACKSGADYCQPPNKCVNGECAIPAPPPPAPKPMPTQRRIPTYIPAGGTCIVGGTPCITGYSCVEGKCAIPYVIPTYIPAGGTCIVGGTPCITGYSCVNAICVIGQSVPMPTCGCTVNCNCYNNDCGGCTANCNCYGAHCCMPNCGSGCDYNGGEGGQCPIGFQCPPAGEADDVFGAGALYIARYGDGNLNALSEEVISEK